MADWFTENAPVSGSTTITGGDWFEQNAPTGANDWFEQNSPNAAPLSPTPETDRAVAAQNRIGGTWGKVLDYFNLQKESQPIEAQSIGAKLLELGGQKLQQLIPHTLGQGTTFAAEMVAPTPAGPAIEAYNIVKDLPKNWRNAVAGIQGKPLPHPEIAPKTFDKYTSDDWLRFGVDRAADALQLWGARAGLRAAIEPGAIETPKVEPAPTTVVPETARVAVPASEATVPVTEAPVAAAPVVEEKPAGAPPEAEYTVLPTEESVHGPPSIDLPVPSESELGPGAASREEYMRRYQLIGASKLLEGHTELGDFSDHMVRDIGTQIGEQLPEIFERSKDVVNELETAGQSKSEMSEFIRKELSGGKMHPLETVKIRPLSALKSIYGAAEKAGQAGYARGLKEARSEGQAAVRQIREELNVADKWMAADQENVRRHMTEFVQKTLPPKERGRFIGAITRALRRPALQRGETVSDPGRMYRNAFNVMQAIENRAEKVYRSDLVGQINKISKRALDSPSVDIPVKQSMRELLSQLGEIDDLPTATLENLHNHLDLLEKTGRGIVKTRRQEWADEKEARLQELESAPAKSIELREQYKPQPGERLSFTQKFANNINRKLNAARISYLGHMPEDVIFDELAGGQGKYSGPVFDHLRTPIDAAHDASARRYISSIEPLYEIVKRNKLTDLDEDVIGLWAHIQQEGGEARAQASGVSPKVIEELKAKGLTKGQKEAYDYMRKTMDKDLPDIQGVMRDLFNVEVVPVKNYFPWQRDYETFKPSADQPVFDARSGEAISPEQLDAYGKLAGNFYPRNTSKLPRGFTIEREPSAKTPIRYDSFDVFRNHQYNASRLIEMQRPLKMAGELIRNDRFAAKYGPYGQKLLNEWLTSAATDGRGNGAHRIRLLDWARKSSNRSMVFFNEVSNIKHASAIPQGMVNAGGPKYYYRGLLDQFGKQGRDFINQFPQVARRQAGDISFAELQRTIDRDPSGLFPKGMTKADRWGFIVGKEVDALNSRAVFIGRYLANLERKGKVPTLEGPIDHEAAYNAMVFMRRTVSSTLAKDIQPVLGRGMGFGGNVSLARTLNAFRQFALERFSLISHDIPAAFKSGNYLRGAALLTAVQIAALYETQIPGAIRKGWHLAFGTPETQKPQETWAHKLALDNFTLVPYVNNLVSLYQWGKTGIPSIDVLAQAIHGAKRFTTAKKARTKLRAGIEAGTAAAEAFGVPGSGRVGRFLEETFAPPQPKGVGKGSEARGESGRGSGEAGGE